jgi:hypothetical protein
MSLTRSAAKRLHEEGHDLMHNFRNYDSPQAFLASLPAKDSAAEFIGLIDGVLCGFESGDKILALFSMILSAGPLQNEFDTRYPGVEIPDSGVEIINDDPTGDFSSWEMELLG